MLEIGINFASTVNRERMPHKAFSLENNPFQVLKANYRSSAAEISQLVEDAELDGIDQEDELQKARQALVTPKARLIFELAWLPELSQLQTNKIHGLLNKADLWNILSEIDHFPELAKANVAAHLCSRGRSSINVVHFLVQSWEEIDEDHILRFLNDQRRFSGFPAVEMNQLRDGLKDIRLRHATAAATWIWSQPLPGTVMNEVVEQELEDNPENSFLRHLVEVYDKESEPHLAVIKESVLTATEAARKVSADLPQHIKEIGRLLEAWDSINQPVQVYSQFRGQEEGRSKQLYEIVRKLCLELANDHGRYEEALKLSSALLATFPELESVAESLKEDITALESLSDQKKISDKLDPLVDACERAKKNASSFGHALRSDGFSESGGKILSDVVRSFNDARRSLPEPGVAYLVVRDLALSLNNESNDPQSSFLLVDGMIDLGGGKAPKEVLEKLRDERTILHKNWKMKELERQNGNVNAMIRIVDELLVYASSKDRSELEQLKAKLKRNTPVNRFMGHVFQWIGIGFLLFIAAAIFGG